MTKKAAEVTPAAVTAPFPHANIPFKDLSATDQEERRRIYAQKRNYMRDRDREKIKIRFKYYECLGGEMKFVFKAYKEDPVEKYSLIDGHIYTLPLGVVRHLNKNCYYKIHEYSMNDRGIATQVVGKKVQRCEAIPLEFVDLEDLSPAGSELLTVQHML